MWQAEPNRLALLELWATGSLRRRGKQTEAWEELLRLGWVGRTGRSDVLREVERYRGDVMQTLDQCWPDWRKVSAELSAARLPPTERGLRELETQERAEKISPLRERLNRRTATAAVATHSKAGLGTTQRELLKGVLLTSDGVLRLRGCQGVQVQRGETSYDGGELERVLGEVVLGERALRDGTRVVGDIQAVLLVENAGPFVDLRMPDGWLLAHVPGWNTVGVRLFMEQVADVPVVHFGDLDPGGVAIFQHLREARPDLRWAVPAFWGEYVEVWGMPAKWPEEIALADTPPLVRRLAAEEVWLEQEAIVLDERLPRALVQMI